MGKIRKEDVLLAMKIFKEQANGDYSKRSYQRLGLKPSYPTILSLYGSWENALNAAGLSLKDVTTYSDEDILNAIRSSVEANNGVVSRSYYMRSACKPSVTTIEARFGSWSEAVTQAGFIANVYTHDRFNDDELIEALRRFYIAHDYRIGYQMYERSGVKPSGSIIRKRFRTWNLALEIAGIPLNQRKDPAFTDTQLVNAMKRVAALLPSELSKEQYKMYTDEDEPSVISIERRYGTWNEALKKAGLPQIRRRYEREEILESVRKFFLHFGEEEASYDFYRKSGWLPGATTIMRKFGTWENVLSELGLEPKFSHYTKEWAITQVKEAAKQNGGTITHAKYLEGSYKPSMTWLKAHFGSWRKVKEEAGFNR